MEGTVDPCESPVDVGNAPDPTASDAPAGSAGSTGSTGSEAPEFSVEGAVCGICEAAAGLLACSVTNSG